MPYIMETASAGRVVEIRKYYTARYCRKGQRRGPNAGETSEKAKKVNQKNAERRLRLLVNANFGYKDIHLVLTYRAGDRPTPGQARKDLEVFLRKLRRAYRERGRELKYISVTEYENAAIHHHLLINNIDTAILPDLWPHGQPRPTYLDRRGDYSRLASYLVKETSARLRRGKGAAEGEEFTGKRWNASRNLEQPVISKRVIKADAWREKPQARGGFYIDADSVLSGVNEDGYAYQSYRMICLRPVETDKGPRERGGKGAAR